MQEKAKYAVVKITWKHEFEVELNDTKVGVELEKKVCGYKYWQLKGIPCVHALAYFNTIRITKTEDYTGPCFHIEAWKKCYLGVIHPISSNNL